ncbi:hypothetical protein evm_012314 [Chilo suppressalis]|nr:hypothetical protein evm_012314 [Chilo suppressalis]
MDGWYCLFYRGLCRLGSSRCEFKEGNIVTKMLKYVLKLLVVLTIFCATIYCETEISKGDAAKEQRQGCGWRNPNGIGFRVESDEKTSQYGEFPWMAAVLKTEPTGEGDSKLNIYTGGASLIHPSVALTAAHLVYKDQPSRLKLRAGEWDTQTTREIYPHQDRNVASVVIHEGYDKGTFANDIALLFLTKPIDLAPNVGLACLPPPQQKVAAGTKCFATGWGKDKFGKEGHYKTILKKIEMPVVDRSECETKLRASRLEKRFSLDPTFMCAGEPGRFTCKGDGGSPLVCPTEVWFSKMHTKQEKCVSKNFWGFFRVFQKNAYELNMPIAKVAY